MGTFDYKGEFPTASLIDAAIKKRQLQQQQREAADLERQRQHDRMLDTLKNAGSAAGSLNKYAMNKKMAETLAGNPAVQGYMTQNNRPVANVGGQQVSLGQTAQGGAGMTPRPNAPPASAKSILPFLQQEGGGANLLKEANASSYKNSNVLSRNAVYDAAGNFVRYDDSTVPRGSKVGSPIRPRVPARPAGAGRGQTRAQLMNTATDNAMAQLRQKYPYGVDDSEAEAYDQEREALIVKEFSRLNSESQGGTGAVPKPAPSKDRQKFVQGAIAKGYSKQQAEKLAADSGL